MKLDSIRQYETSDEKKDSTIKSCIDKTEPDSGIPIK
jgi:hypothetical protein